MVGAVQAERTRQSPKLRALLLRVEPSTPESAVMGNAVNFARRTGAELWGLYPLEYPEFPGYVEARLPRELLEINRNHFKELAEETGAAFRKACESAAIDWTWRCVEGDAARSVIVNGRVADLLLLAGGKESNQSSMDEFTGQVILQCGRPAMILPSEPMAEDAGSRVVLAWNARRECVRATHDAMPLLRNAEWVKVVTLKRGSAADQDDVPGAGICRHLARHGVAADAHVVSFQGRSAGAALLEWARENDADMLVMGAYGHSRWRELVLGGVTAHVLRNADLPVFMSH